MIDNTTFSLLILNPNSDFIPTHHITMVQAQASLALDDQLSAGWFSWFTNKGILKLNAILCLSLISSYATGYDGSMMNGLQSLDTWKADFNNPDANKLAM